MLRSCVYDLVRFQTLLHVLAMSISMWHMLVACLALVTYYHTDTWLVLPHCSVLSHHSTNHGVEGARLCINYLFCVVIASVIHYV